MRKITFLIIRRPLRWPLVQRISTATGTTQWRRRRYAASFLGLPLCVSSADINRAQNTWAIVHASYTVLKADVPEFHRYVLPRQRRHIFLAAVYRYAYNAQDMYRRAVAWATTLCRRGPDPESLDISHLTAYVRGCALFRCAERR